MTHTHDTITHANAWLDGWREGIDEPEHPARRVDVGGHSASWLAGYRAARQDVGAVDQPTAGTQTSESHDTPGLATHAVNTCPRGTHEETTLAGTCSCVTDDPGVDDPCDLAVCPLTRAIEPNADALLHVIRRHPDVERAAAERTARAVAQIVLNQAI